MGESSTICSSRQGLKESRGVVTSTGITGVALLRLVLCYSVQKPTPCENSKCMLLAFKPYLTLPLFCGVFSSTDLEHPMRLKMDVADSYLVPMLAL